MSLEFKGTKGKWDVSYASLFKTYMVHSENVDNQIANISHFKKEKYEAEANAKLIAAAPELLGMLIRCDEWISNCSEEAKILTDIRQLIKKATE